LGDYYLRNRFYDITSGRFLRRDIYEGWFDEPLSLHKYAYVHNNPVNLIDPLGLYSMQQGNMVHDAIGLDFSRSGSRRVWDQNFRGGQRLTVKRILREADGLSLGFPGFNRKRVDLADYETHQFYEIKPVNRFAEGVQQIADYLFILNFAPGQTNRWHIGSASNYIPSPVIPLPTGEIALVAPPTMGVITYTIHNPRLALAVLEATNAALLATLLVAAITVASLARGFA
jgi:hypothetical protein